MKLFIPLKYVGESTRYALRDPKCFLSANRSHLVGEFNLNECGTQIRFEKDAIIFSNVLSHVSDPHQSVISVECEYPRRQNLSTGYEFPSHSKVDIYEKGKGVGIIDIRRYTTNRYTDKITSENSDSPRPGDDIYVELAVDQKSPNSLGVVADLCVASPTPYPAGREVITLIENNCKQENHPVTIYDTIKELMRFSFPAPDFEGTGRVYVHCQVSVCSKTTDCDPNCSTRRSKRSARPSFLITSGPIVLNTSSDMFLTSSNIAIGCLSLLSLVLLTAVFVLIKQRLPKQIL